MEKEVWVGRWCEKKFFYVKKAEITVNIEKEELLFLSIIEGNGEMVHYKYYLFSYVRIPYLAIATKKRRRNWWDFSHAKTFLTNWAISLSKRLSDKTKNT